MLSKDQKDKVITKLLGSIYTNKEDPGTIHIDAASMFQSLDSFGFILHEKEFSQSVEKVLNEQKPPDLSSNNNGKYLVAIGILNLAEKMNIEVEKLEQYYMSEKGQQEMANEGSLSLEDLQAFRQKNRKEYKEEIWDRIVNKNIPD